jgi:hypothetical protein
VALPRGDRRSAGCQSTSDAAKRVTKALQTTPDGVDSTQTASALAGRPEFGLDLAALASEVSVKARSLRRPVFARIRPWQLAQNRQFAASGAPLSGQIRTAKTYQNGDRAHCPALRAWTESR